MKEVGLSERRACSLAGISWISYRYVSKVRDDEDLVARRSGNTLHIAPGSGAPDSRLWCESS